jgi:centromere/kinetochore protein ZW10
MPSEMSHQALGDALIQSVKDGSFPQSEDVASAPLTSAVVPELLQALKKAQEEHRSEIRAVASKTAPDVDQWINDARKLRADIERSQTTAQEIAQQAESKAPYTAKIQDAASRVSFLYSEIAYSANLKQTLRELKNVAALLEDAQTAQEEHRYIDALGMLEEIQPTLKRSVWLQSTRAGSELGSKADQLRTSITDKLKDHWHYLLGVNEKEREVVFTDELGYRLNPVTVHNLVEALAKLGILDGLITRFAQDLDHAILMPTLCRNPDDIYPKIKFENDRICLRDRAADVNARYILRLVQSVGRFLTTHLPRSILVPLTKELMPTIAHRLIVNWLNDTAPRAIASIPKFQDILAQVLSLADYFDELGWSGQQILRDWVSQAPDVWLASQKTSAAIRVRNLFSKRIHERHIVERVETQKVAKNNDSVADTNEQDENWGADWGDEPGVEQDSKKPTPAATQKEDEIEEEDLSAWGVDEEEGPPTEETNDKQGLSEAEQEDPSEEGADAWDWQEEEEDTKEDSTAAPANRISNQSTKSAEIPRQSQATEQEVSLREAYTITGIPDALMDVITQVVADVETLRQPEFEKTVIGPASSGLFDIPKEVLTVYRATSAAYYSKEMADDMLIYNDCLRLSDRLRSLISELAHKDVISNRPPKLQPSIRMDVQDDIKMIESFGRRAYAKEMESQRTIIRDLLDGAQGFQSCTTPPFAIECDNAISMTVDRVHEVKRQWEDVLSHSALLQSLGSLVSTALAKFITDLEDLSDISEKESQKLRYYCDQLSTLSKLFTTAGPGGDARDETSIYTPNWFRFQYLSEILDGTLADIKYMWTEGELKLEMGAEEVIDLIKALFSDSEHRRKAIGDIRRAFL